MGYTTVSLTAEQQLSRIHTKYRFHQIKYSKWVTPLECVTNLCWPNTWSWTKEKKSRPCTFGLMVPGKVCVEKQRHWTRSPNHQMSCLSGTLMVHPRTRLSVRTLTFT